MRNLLFLVSLFCLGGCAAPQGGEDVASSSARNSTNGCSVLRDTAPGRPQAYFAPFDPVEAQALCVLDTAKKEVVVAHYNIRTERMLRKLVELKDRGVDVRVAVDQANAANAWNTGDDFLERSGVKLVRTKPAAERSIMHLKVSVIDNEIAMTGSFNWNETAAGANDENMVVFRDAEVVRRYHDQVLEVLGEQPHKVEGGKATDKIALHFAPEEKVDLVIAKELDKAAQSIDVAMFTFTMNTLTSALKRAIARGVKVRLVLEQKQLELSRADEELEAAGAQIVRGANKIGPHSAMHQKYAVIDGKKVITGATNWTYAGTRSNEEDLIIVDDAAFAAGYRKNFADLLYVYGRLDADSLPSESSAILFHAIHGGTAWGDAVVVTGSDPALGSWDPRRGVPLETNELFPNWTGRARVPAGTRLEYKIVTLRASGEVEWEPGANRVLELPASGRSVVISGNFGDTSKSWTPAP